MRHQAWNRLNPQPFPGSIRSTIDAADQTVIQYMPSEEFVKDFSPARGANRIQTDDPANRFVRNPLNIADRTAEISAASCDKNSTEVR